MSPWKVRECPIKLNTKAREHESNEAREQRSIRTWEHGI